MAALPPPDKLQLLGKLDPIQPEPASDREDEKLEAMSLGRALRTVAELQCEPAYKLCREVAERALGRLPEPERPIED